MVAGNAGAPGSPSAMNPCSHHAVVPGGGAPSRQAPPHSSPHRGLQWVLWPTPPPPTLVPRPPCTAGPPTSGREPRFILHVGDALEEFEFEGLEVHDPKLMAGHYARVSDRTGKPRAVFGEDLHGRARPEGPERSRAESKGARGTPKQPAFPLRTRCVRSSLPRA